jgi:hypothetical protein
MKEGKSLTNRKKKYWLATFGQQKRLILVSICSIQLEEFDDGGVFFFKHVWKSRSESF